ncbi:Dihydroneopterin aldolase [bioreactor metagenome]|uniref:dihydroneopterin aldolase n=1 Tax=bioreactor metagenome TaxID=1076179 RepID=A0A644T932_9ZZZZ|nr:dihydroneopterin aldolase [Negativicutes bacterium]
MADKILLCNMMFYAFHGVFEYEREQGQRFYVDVELSTDVQEAGQKDDLNCAVDYTAVYQKIKEIVETHRYKLLEALVSKISDELLKIDRVNSVTVRIRKPGVPIPGQIDYVQLEITRER